MRPLPGDYAPYYTGYVNYIEEEEPLEALMRSYEELEDFFPRVTPENLNFRYAPEKWSVIEVLVHLMDCEVIFTNRALQIARGEQKPLPGFDQDEYVHSSSAQNMTLDQIRSCMRSARNLAVDLFRTFDEATLARKGVANNNDLTVNSVAFIIAGHQKHHLEILKNRYAL